MRHFRGREAAKISKNFFLKAEMFRRLQILMLKNFLKRNPRFADHSMLIPVLQSIGWEMAYSFQEAKSGTLGEKC